MQKNTAQCVFEAHGRCAFLFLGGREEKAEAQTDKPQEKGKRPAYARCGSSPEATPGWSVRMSSNGMEIKAAAKYRRITSGTKAEKSI